MEKKCLLVTGTNPGAEKQVPVGLIYLGTQLKKHGYIPEIFHVTDRKSLEECRNKITSTKYLFAGFSLWMGETIADMIELTKTAKKCGIPTMWGGKFVSSIKAEAFTEESVDIAAMGHAEETIVEMANAIYNGTSLANITGIYYRSQEGEVIKTPNRVYPITNLDEYDYDLSLITDWTPYIIKPNTERIMLDPFESSRGCLFKCRFCFHSDDEIYSEAGNKKLIRFHSVDFVIKKAQQLKDLTGVKKISYCDDEFWIDGKRSLEIIRRLKEIGIELIFIRVRFTSLNEEMIKKLCEYEMTSIACGLESGNARILKMMNKGLTLDIAKEKMRMLAKYPIIVNMVIIIGNPTETKEEMLESVRFAYDLREIKRNLNILAFFYRPLPSTDFGAMAEKLGFKRPKTVSGWINVAYEHIADIGDQWLPWYDKTQKKYMKRYEECMIANDIICEKLYGSSKKNLIIILFWPLFYIFEKITFYRLYNWYFGFPIDVKLYSIGHKFYHFIKRTFVHG